MNHHTIRGYEYMVIDKLPTQFRSYTQDTVYVRGLYHPEAVMLAKYIGYAKTNYKQLAEIYKNAIQGIDIYDLEISDFIVCTIISSIYTQKDFGWIPNIPCKGKINNPEIEKLSKQIIELQNSDEPNESEIAELRKKLEETPEKVICGANITDPIILDDLEFKDTYDGELPIKHSINGKTYDILPLTLRDIIEIEDNKDNEMYDEVYFSYSRLIKGDYSSKEKYNIVYNGNFGDVEELREIDKKFKVDIKPVTKRCSKCGTPVNIQLSLMNIKAHP